MTIQSISIGNQVNDGLGDDLRTAFLKVNNNFSSLAAELTITVTNLGDIGEGLFKQRVGGDLQFKKLAAGRYVAIEPEENYIRVRNSAPSSFTRIYTDGGNILATDTANQITMEGIPATATSYHPASHSGIQDIEVTTSGTSIQFKTQLPVTDILTTYDFGSINGSFNNTIQFALAWANIDFGLFTLPATVDLDCGSII
jgi:hypothetical protein